ncbi:uncharacterized protein LOC133626223 isoform X3 [Colius striatus]|uniref:uncharacterized protein LOC133626223 isoform X3 n=1 Tax=Colius striatus TaxID=57412 RepID=UPI002B1D4E24|nr:uncharacterized protein LOC133626223 isoform X3 [Colius striatus]
MVFASLSKIAYELPCSPPSHSHHSSPCTMYSQLSSPMGDRTIHHLLTTKRGQDKGPGTNPLALSSEQTDEGAAASPGKAWETASIHPSAFGVLLVLQRGACKDVEVSYPNSN